MTGDPRVDAALIRLHEHLEPDHPLLEDVDDALRSINRALRIMRREGGPEART